MPEPIRPAPRAPAKAADGPAAKPPASVPAPRPVLTAAPEPRRNPLPVYDNQAVSLDLSGIRALYIGQPLSGKTTKMLTWPGLVVIQFDEERSVVDGHSTQIPVIQVRSWELWESQILPAIRGRKGLTAAVQSLPGFADYEIQTVAIDSFTGMGEMVETHCRALESNQMRMYGDKLVRLRATKTDLFSITKASPGGSPPWNLIGAVHERALTRSIKNERTNQFEEIVEGIVPSITGQFGERFLEYWSVILWCFYEIPTTPDGTIVRGASAKYPCFTTPIDQWRRGVDRLGGGRLPRLPARVSGNYPDLVRHWGLTTEEKGSEE